MARVRRLWLGGFLVAVLAVAMAGPVAAAVNPNPTTGVPTVTITAPVNGASLPGPSVRLRFSVSGVVLTNPGAHPHDVAGQGHIRVWVNESSGTDVYTDSYTLTSLPAGSYRVSALLLSNTAQALAPQQGGSVTFTVVGQTTWTQWATLVFGVLVLVVVGGMMLRQWRRTGS